MSISFLHSGGGGGVPIKIIYSESWDQVDEMVYVWA